MNKPKFIESIRLEKGVLQNLKFHQQRVNQTSKIFSFNKTLDLRSIALTKINDDDIYKFRVLYSENDYSVEITRYKQREIRSLKLVYDNDIVYDHKFENRDALNELFEKRGDSSDILIVKNGFITDSSYSNIVLFDGEDYFTPSTFLLNGTMRQRLLDEKRIKEREIKPEDLKNYKQIFLINALNSIDDNHLTNVPNIIF
ncbi:MAG: aminotransferase class IV [Bacteroidales bacterium]|nr:aminotransferase class IV [Bacteroidales bacterium]MDD4685431.1 aminotransferase class IV [Bacteroidales bacterium]